MAFVLGGGVNGVRGGGAGAGEGFEGGGVGGGEVLGGDGCGGGDADMVWLLCWVGGLRGDEGAEGFEDGFGGSWVRVSGCGGCEGG